jgi:aspartate dehydrogenase
MNTVIEDPARIQSLCLIGFGAIGQALYQRLGQHPRVQISHVVVRESQLAAVRKLVDPSTTVLTEVPAQASLALECAGHGALLEHVLPALHCGIECAVLSVGALAHDGLAEDLADAAQRGNTQVHLLPGAIGGIDAIAAAKLAGLRSVRYIGRKPPLAWRGTPAEQQFNLEVLASRGDSTVLLEASAREAALLYPKNANVAATVSLAGLGLDATQVRLIADPTQSENVHEIELEGAFGRMRVEMRGNPLPDNPKTSMLTVLAAQRFIENRVASIAV